MPSQIHLLSILSFVVIQSQLAGAASTATSLAEPIRAIHSVGPEGAGHVPASAAWRTLAATDAAMLPVILAGMAGANDLAANWLRSAVETIATRELKSGGKLPQADLQKFIGDTRHDPRARRLAFELVARVDASLADRLLTELTNDPSAELRRDAVGKLMKQAAQALAASDKPAATRLFQQSLSAARDVDQINDITKQLRALGQVVDLPKVFGFITQWNVIGPFDSIGGKGFAAVYPPEEKIDLSGEYDGKTGRVRWRDFVTTNEYGLVSMNLPYTPLKGAAAYAFTEFHADKPQAVEIRLGSQNAWKVWLNGRYLFGQDEYHRNKAIDQYRLNAELQKGRNVILVKVCQNEQTDDWAVDWDFQLRVCDPFGSPIFSTVAPAKTTP
ncbi:MAG: hypothetical protein H7X97_01710 [Opitutaceae bacterium]|nr:hypothetical protein [Verrucomicrobiales bacterium]